MRFSSTRIRSLSAPGMSWSSSSTTVTLEPSASYTVAISSPMMPPPITSSCSGISSTSSAPVESITRGSSGTNGSVAASEPAAMMQLSNATTVSPTAIVFGPVNSPVPRTTWTLRCLASDSRPPVSRPTTPSFQARTLSMSTLGSLNSIPASPSSPASVSTLAMCSSAFDGMQPTFRQTPPSCSPRSIRATDSPRSAARNAAV